MKKLTASLGDTLGNLRTTASAVSAAAATQINRTLGDSGGGGGSRPAGPPPESADKQYLRLPVDSARKLRWYDKGDVQQLTRQHLREKHVLLDTITALKKVRLGAAVLVVVVVVVVVGGGVLVVVAVFVAAALLLVSLTAGARSSYCMRDPGSCMQPTHSPAHPPTLSHPTPPDHDPQRVHRRGSGR